MMAVKGASYIDPRTWALNACLTIWSTRLAWHIGVRHEGEDYRYIDIRRNLEKYGKTAYYFLSFICIFMLQASLSVVVNYTVLRTTAMSSAQSLTAGKGLKLTDYAGLALFAAGFMFEAVGDS